MTRLRSGAVAALIAVAACATAPPPSRPPVPPTPSPPAAKPTPAVVPTPSPLAAAPVGHTEPPLIRLLIARTREPVELGQPGRAYLARRGGGQTWIWGPVRLTPVAGARSWQAGAFRSEETASAAARRLESALGGTAVASVVSHQDGLFRVRVRWPGLEPADAAARLRAAGVPDAFAVQGAGSLRVESAAGSVEPASGELVLEPQGAWPTAVGGRSYHGLLRLRVVGDELLVINQLNLESYLKGVVPAEMGPSQFPELEGLKAQAVAARTYAVAHLGDGDAEGFDLCSTPACQVYAGAGAQHPLSDRAVDETAGLIAAFDGAPIDAMYTSTCGGRTEDASLLFSGRAQPYLKGVACAWERPIRLTGVGGAQVFHGESEFRVELATRALDVARTAEPRQVVERVVRLCGGRAVALGQNPTADQLADALLSAGGLDGAAPLVGGGGASGLARLADLFGIELEEMPPDLRSHGWHLRAALAVLELQGVVLSDAGEAVPHPAGAAIFPRGAARSEPLPEGPLPLFWRWPPVWTGAAALDVLPGATLERYRVGDELLALVVVRSDGDADADRRSAWRSWARDRSWTELAERLGVIDLERLEVTRRGPSGRVVGLAAVGRSGARVELEGFPIRRSLDLPENLFSFHTMTRPDGTRIVRFLGRAWGHGVGLCQNGAYGLARSGMTFDRILEHYYTGIEIQAWNGVEVQR